MHGALLLPSVRKALHTEGKRSWVSQVHFVLRPTAPPPWLRTSAAAVRNHGSSRSVTGGATHESQCCGERAVQRCVCASCPAASARLQRVSCQRHPPARSKLRRRRFSAVARLMAAACSHGASCSTAVARTSSVGGAPPLDAAQKTASVLLAVFARL